MRYQGAGILRKVQSVGPHRAHDLEPAVRPVLDPVLALLDPGLKAANARKDQLTPKARMASIVSAAFSYRRSVGSWAARCASPASRSS